MGHTIFPCIILKSKKGGIYVCIIWLILCCIIQQIQHCKTSKVQLKLIKKLKRMRFKVNQNDNDQVTQTPFQTQQ